MPLLWVVKMTLTPTIGGDRTPYRCPTTCKCGYGQGWTHPVAVAVALPLPLDRTSRGTPYSRGRKGKELCSFCLAESTLCSSAVGFKGSFKLLLHYGHDEGLAMTLGSAYFHYSTNISGLIQCSTADWLYSENLTSLPTLHRSFLHKTPWLRNLTYCSLPNRMIARH